MKTPGWQMLNAYVDGELSPQEAAEVACAAGADPWVADQIALLHNVKSSAHAAMPPVPDDLASLIPPPPRPRIVGQRGAAIAAVMAVACVLLVGLFWSGRDAQPGNNEFFASARALHERWLQRDAVAAERTTPAVLAALTRFGRLPVVPDLESTGLEIAAADVSERQDGLLLQIGYRGHHGCHLSLFVIADQKFSDNETQVLGPLDRSFAWHVGDLSYLLFAVGMDPSRFRLIAEKVERASRTSTPLSAQDKQQLADNHLASARCQA